MPAKNGKNAESEVISIQPLIYETAVVELIGETGLIVNKWSNKAIELMERKQGGKAKVQENRDPQAEYEASLYKLPDGRYGFPAVGFKAAIIGALRLFDGIPMTRGKIAMFVRPQATDEEGNGLIIIDGVPQMRRDMVRLESGVATPRYRGWFPEWRAVIEIEYNLSILPRDVMASLVSASGKVGIGEWRPSAPKSMTGDYGRYFVNSIYVHTSKEVKPEVINA